MITLMEISIVISNLVKNAPAFPEVMSAVGFCFLGSAFLSSDMFTIFDDSYIGDESNF